MLIPTTQHVGVTTIATGLNEALNARDANSVLLPALDIESVEQFLGQNHFDDLLELIVANRQNYAAEHGVVITSGITLAKPYAAELNYKIAMALDADIIFLASPNGSSIDKIGEQFRVLIMPYINHGLNIIGCIINKALPSEVMNFDNYCYFGKKQIKVLGVIPYRNDIYEAGRNNYLEQVKTQVAKYIDVSWIWQIINSVSETRITPSLFRYNLIAKARAANKIIILPEGDEPRTIQAANICAEKNIACCILLGDKNSIYQTATNLSLPLNEKVKIIDPTAIREKYVDALVEMRKSKGLTPDMAREQLNDNVMLGTVMLKLNEVDGLVSGALHTTANTIRPALQIIKTAPGVNLASSIFFMCLPEQVLVFGDCAINQNPSVAELADIAIQSADSAKAFGITPRVAMLSYSTGTSGSGESVDKVRAATELVKQKRSDLAVEGPIQYDAAVMPEVARLKAPNSNVAGKATVLIFPNLDVANVTYKAVQRSAEIVCFGPMIQGLQKPVNDLSRGCLVEDIVYTIALTSVQGLST